MRKPRCVVDTNVLISTAISPSGAPRKAVAWIIQHGQLIASEATITELESRLRQDKFDRYLNDAEREEYLTLIRESSHFVETTSKVRESLDPDDNKFLELALDAEADCIVSGDKRHLLPLHPFRGITILSPVDFLERTEQPHF